MIFAAEQLDQNAQIKIYSLTLNKLKDIAPDKHTILKNRMKEKTENVRDANVCSLSRVSYFR